MSWAWQIGITAVLATLALVVLYVIGDRRGRRKRYERQRERRLKGRAKLDSLDPPMRYVNPKRPPKRKDD